MKHVDYIIVGQGIAGTMLASYLGSHGKTFMIVDQQNDSSASRVAAGIIHPVTGRRMVKTWMADTLIPFAKSAYIEIEKALGVKVFYPVPVRELLYSSKEYNDWMARSEDPEVSVYIDCDDATTKYDAFLQPYFKSVLIKQSAWIDTGSLLAPFREKFLQEGALLEEKFDHLQLKLKDDGVEYQNIAASKIIFCEGIEAMRNPFWKHLPFIPAKGELLIIKADLKLDCILNRKIFILPLGEKLFKVGSTYAWNFEDSKPTEDAKQFLIAQLKGILKIPFEVIGHQAAVRPSVKNRRPFLGLHPQHKQVSIFNGLGTKGCLLAPYFAAQLAGYLAGKNELEEEVSAGRYQSAV